jgi:hypothetical protein
MKNSNNIIGNRTRDLPACSLNQLRHRVPRQLVKQKESNEAEH